MNALRTFIVIACLMTATLANSRNRDNSQGRGGRHQNSNSLNDNLDPSQWVTVAQIDSLPHVNDVTLKKLESLSTDDGATMIDQLYHLSQVNRVFAQTYTPDVDQIQGYIVQPTGNKVTFNMNTFVQTVKQEPNFGDDEVTIYITGLPQSWSTVKKATRSLEEAYMQRYNLRPYGDPDKQNKNSNNAGSSEENENNASNNKPSGNLVVIDLGEKIRNFEQFATLNIERVGQSIAERLVQLTNQVDVPQEIIHIVGQGMGAHVAGVAGRQYTRLTGHKVRRITALDPSRIFGKAEKTLNGLARGDADFVDAIHTSAYGMGTADRVGDADFYPNGPNTGVPGADNVVEATMRATRYYAESVRPGNERNFPAVAASSYKDYKQNNGHGPRAFMGVATSYDVEGDYMLQVNPKSPFGKSSPAQRQNNYHAVHQPWNNNNNQRGNRQDSDEQDDDDDQQQQQQQQQQHRQQKQQQQQRNNRQN